MDIGQWLDDGLRLNWERRNPLVDGPVEFHVKYGDWTALVWFTVTRGDDEWVIQAWNRKRPDLPSINSLYDDCAGFLTASDAMRFCERWLIENAG